MQDWYYSTFGAEFGPFSLQDLIDLAKSEQLLADDPVKLGANGPWRKAGSIIQLSAYIRSPLQASNANQPEQASPAKTQSPPPRRYTSALHSSGHQKPKPTSNAQPALKSKSTDELMTVETKSDLQAIPSTVSQTNEIRNSDDELLRTIADTLAARNISSFTRIGLDVKRGEITVRGTVASEGERLLLIHLLQKTPRVVAINDGLVISSKTSSIPAKASTAISKPQAPISRPKPYVQKSSFNFNFNFNIFESLKLNHLAYGIAGIVFLGVAGLVVQASSSRHHLAVYPTDGRLSLDGTPMEGATVILNPISSSGELKQVQIRGTVDSEGRFQLSTYGERDGAPAGNFVVTVLWCKTVKIDGETSFGPNLAPAKYSTPEKSDIKATITRGTNHLEPIELKADPAAAKARK